MRKILSLLGFCTVIFLSACVRINYVGQTFPPLEEGEYVEFYRSLEEVPPELKPIGRGTAMLPIGIIDDDIYELFAEKAAKIGATAFAVSESQKVLIGVTDEIESRPTRPDANWSVDGTDGEGRSVYTNTFGREEELNVIRKSHYKLKFTVVFYVPIESFNQHMNKTAVENTPVENKEEK